MSGHIALLLPDLRAGGAQRVFLVLAREFLAKGFRVDIVVGLAEGNLVSEVPLAARLLPLCSNVPMLGRPGLAVVMFFHLVRYFSQHQPDMLISTLSGTNIVAAAAHRMAKVPTRLVLREASRLVNLRHGFYITLMRRAYRWADIIVALTPEMQAELERELRLPPNRVIQIPNPIDFKRLEHDANVVLPADFDPTQPYVLAVGRLSPPKDFLTLVQAFSRVSQAVPVNLIILGEGPDRPKIEAKIHELSLEERVELRGFDPNPYRWMARALVFVLSSRWEGYPNVIVEAQAFGVPVVATEYDLSARSLVHSPGCVVPVGDDSAMADAITDLLGEMGHAGGLSSVSFSDNKKHDISGKSTGNDSIEKYIALMVSDVHLVDS